MLLKTKRSSVFVAIFLYQIMFACSEIEIEYNFIFCDSKQQIIDKLSIYKNEPKPTVNKCLKQMAKYPLDEFLEYPKESSNFLYQSNDGNFFGTECSTINKVYVYRNVEFCFKDILIRFLDKTVQIDGFLTKNGFIRKKSIQTECLLKEVIFWIKNLKFIKYKNFIEILNSANIQDTLINKTVSNFIEKINDNIFSETTKQIIPIAGFIVAIVLFIFGTTIRSLVLPRLHTNKIKR